jgi:pyruvate,water dikinase
LIVDPDAPNPTNRGACASRIAWSTSNTAEALPGVATPFTWSYFGDGVEAGMRAAHHDLGALRRNERAVPHGAEGRFWDCFYGRTAGNVDTARMLADRLPGTSANAYEEQLFGQVRPGMQNHPDHRRLPVVAVMLPYQIAMIGRRERAMSADVQAWWRRVTGPGAPVDRAGARALMLEAADRLRAAMRPHVVATLLCEVFYGQVRQLAAKAGRPGLEISLCTGYGDMAETAVAADLWSVSRDRLPLAEFLQRHGFHGPGEGETSNPSWRVDPAPLQPILAGYRQLGEDRDPRIVETNRARGRREAERELLASMPAVRRPGARLVLKQAARIIPLRGVGKAAFLRCIDAQRTAASVYARTLVGDGLLDRPEDIYFLTIRELTAPTLPGDCRGS